ncbi:MAG: hypothetical protein ACYS9T_00720 [Planctomycetota bacterium]|jgi:hypothetical protein
MTVSEISLLVVGTVIVLLILLVIVQRRLDRKAERSRRQELWDRAEKVIRGEVQLTEGGLVDLMTDVLIECKKDKDSGADQTVLRANSELVENLCRARGLPTGEE